MRFEMNTMGNRHLVFAYAVVIVIQGGYLLWIVRDWLTLRKDQKKTTKPAV